MANTPLAFVPAGGLTDKSSFPTVPANEDAARLQIQTPMNQIRDYINGQMQTDLAATYAKKTQEAWIAPTLLNGWVNTGTGWSPAGYMKDTSGYVHIRGLIKSGATGNATILFVLPAGYRPAYELVFITSTDAGGSPLTARIDVTSSGNLLFMSGGNGYVALDNIPPFLAEA